MGTSRALIPAAAHMYTRRHTGNLSKHRREAHALTRDESSELAPFSDVELHAKPLVAFEAPPENTALPVTWASSSS